MIGATSRRTEDNLGLSVEDIGTPCSNASTSNNESSSYQPSVNETSLSDAATDLTHDTPSNGSSSTAETEASEGVNDSNIRRIDSSASVVNGFDDGCDTDKEIGPFYDAIPDLDERSIDDDNACVWREDDSEQEIETELPVSTEDAVSSESAAVGTESALPNSIAIESIPRMCAKHLKEQLTARSLFGTGVKATLIDRLNQALNDNKPVLNASLIVAPLPIVRVAPTSTNNR